MCGVLEGLAIAGGLSSYMGGQSAAKANADAQEANLKNRYKQTSEKMNQVNERMAMETAERYKQGLIDRAEAKAIANESGALGFNTDRLMADSLMQQGTDIMSIEKNRSNEMKQAQWDNQSYYAAAQSSVNSGYNNAPGLIDTGLSVGTEIYKAHELEKLKTTA